MHEVDRPEIQAGGPPNAEPIFDTEHLEEAIDLVAPHGSREPALDQRDPRLRDPGSPVELSLRPAVRAPFGSDDQAEPLEELAMPDGVAHDPEYQGGLTPHSFRADLGIDHFRISERGRTDEGRL